MKLNTRLYFTIAGYLVFTATLYQSIDPKSELFSQDSEAAACIMAARLKADGSATSYGCTELNSSHETVQLCKKMERMRENTPLSRYIPLHGHNCKELGFPGDEVTTPFGYSYSCSVAYERAMVQCPDKLVNYLKNMVGW